MPNIIHKRLLSLALVLAFAGASSLLAYAAFVDEYKSGIAWPEPVVVDPGSMGGPPSDAVVLFDGKDLSKWKGGEKWEIIDGHATTKGAALKPRTPSAIASCTWNGRRLRRSKGAARDGGTAAFT